MKKTYDIADFVYINGKNNINVLSGTNCEANETTILCFDGFAYFKTYCGYFKMVYPKFKDLTWAEQDQIYYHKGFNAEEGDFAAICSTLGVATEITCDDFTIFSDKYLRDVPPHIKEYLTWLDYEYCDTLTDGLEILADKVCCGDSIRMVQDLYSDDDEIRELLVTNCCGDKIYHYIIKKNI